MLTDAQREALENWYSRPDTVSQMKFFVERESWEELEEYVQMTSLFPLSRHDELPDYMLDEEGAPLFPTNLNPQRDLTVWQDAVEVGWEIVERNFDLTHDELHRRVAKAQKQDWKVFMKSVEERKKQREQD